MQILSSDKLVNIKGGSSIMITPYYGFIKAMKRITKFIKSRF